MLHMTLEPGASLGVGGNTTSLSVGSSTDVDDVGDAESTASAARPTADTTSNPVSITVCAAAAGVPGSAPIAAVEPVEERRRGKLKIYLGAAPGVGKTCAALGELHQLVVDGVDAVVGLVEDHDREYTASLIDGLEVIARDSHGELDVNAVLRRAPQVALVDEFAHTNRPGSRHKKRFGDICELLDAGVDVISTLNIQHLESLNDVVASITGIIQHETVPDAQVRAAETIELVDLSPEFLRTRLADGRIYKPERIGVALTHYFRIGNLTALRELALLWLADQVDDALARYREAERITDTWETRERVVVAVSDESDAEPLIRRGRRIAQKASAELLVCHVIGGDGFQVTALTAMPRIRTLAEDLNAEIHQVTGDSIPAALLQFARSVNATQLVLGAPVRSRIRWRLRESTAAAVVRDCGRIDVHLVTLGRPARWQLPSATDGMRVALRWLAALLTPPTAAALLRLVAPCPTESALGLVSSLFFAVVLGVSLFAGIWPAIVSAVLSGLVMNWFFTPPVGTFTISAQENAATLAVMLAIALAVALLVDRARQAAKAAKLASQQADLLSLFSRSVLTDASCDSLLARVGQVFGCRSVLARSGGVVIGSWYADDADADTDPPASGNGAIGTEVTSGDGTLTMDLRGGDIRADHRGVLAVVADQLSGLEAQKDLAQQAARAHAIAAADDLRRALLSAVGHDLRTPLASAKLAASSLRATDVEFSPEDRLELLQTIEEDVDQLTRLVGNLLDSSRLAAGAVTARRDEVPVGDCVARAIASCAIGRRREEMARVRVMPSAMRAVVVGDDALLERVFANLVDNALTHAPGAQVMITARESEAQVLLRVVDRGPGLPRGEEDPFRPFQRLGDADPSTGVGLGLAVVRGFVEAMGGSIRLVPAHPGCVAEVRLPAVVEDSEEVVAGVVASGGAAVAGRPSSDGVASELSTAAGFSVECRPVRLRSTDGRHVREEGGDR